MITSIENELVQTVDGIQGVLYANQRYYIPFGWWANPVLRYGIFDGSPNRVEYVEYKEVSPHLYHFWKRAGKRHSFI